MKDENEPHVDKLIAVKEHITVLHGMLMRKQRSLDKEIELAAEAERGIDEVLYGLTGDSFYRGNKEREEGHDG